MRILIVIDDCTRECLALADTSISGIRVARELDQLLADRGKPKMIVSDNGTELTTNAICDGQTITKSLGTTSRLEAGRMLSLSHSLAACATSCSSN